MCPYCPFRTLFLRQDYVNRKHRARWSYIEALTSFAWSGSAAVGGLLIKRYDYQVGQSAWACGGGGACVCVCVEMCWWSETATVLCLRVGGSVTASLVRHQDRGQWGLQRRAWRCSPADPALLPWVHFVSCMPMDPVLTCSPGLAS
eukprot:350808-Chlamydomonas_euryale.AAC.6